MIHYNDLHNWIAPSRLRRQGRKAAIIVLAAMFMVFMMALMAFSIDLGYLLSARTEMQRTADAAALAGAWEMANADFNVRVTQSDSWSGMDSNARLKAASMAAMNQVISTDPQLELAEDISVGYLANPSDHNETMSFPALNKCNTVQVRVRYSSDINQPISYFFAPILGITSDNLLATASAIYPNQNIDGFKPPNDPNKSSLMPFTIKIDEWNNLLAGGGPDNWAVDPETGAVSPGHDGIPEMRMFPERENTNQGHGNSQGVGGGITPGNFGTVDIGNNNNAAPDLWRQIRYGPNDRDFSYYPNNELKLDPVTHNLSLNGDTGITASMKSALDDIINDPNLRGPRTIFLYDNVTGQGNNTWFNIVGFAGIRVLDYSMQGNDKYILVQPSMVFDNSSIAGNGDTSDFVGQPVHLVR